MRLKAWVWQVFLPLLAIHSSSLEGLEAFDEFDALLDWQGEDCPTLHLIQKRAFITSTHSRITTASALNQSQISHTFTKQQANWNHGERQKLDDLRNNVNDDDRAMAAKNGLILGLSLVLVIGCLFGLGAFYILTAQGRDRQSSKFPQSPQSPQKFKAQSATLTSTPQRHGHGHGHGHVHGHGVDDCCTDSHGQGHGHGHGHGHVLLDSDGHGHGHGAAQSREPNVFFAGHGHGHSIPYREETLLSQSLSWLRMHDPAEHEPGEDASRHATFTTADLCDQCDQSDLTFTTNVIVTVRASELIAMSRMNSFLALTAVMYIAMELVLIILNCTHGVAEAVYHRLEFWSTFIFNTVDVFALIYSPKNLSNQYTNPTLLKIMVLFSVGVSFLTSILVTLNLEMFEVVAHELDYLNEFTMTVFDATILTNLMRGRLQSGGRDFWTTAGLAVVASVAITQICIYNLMGWVHGVPKGEFWSHLLEFVFGVISASITFWFTMDNKMSADLRLRQIMHGPLEQSGFGD